MTVIVSSCMQFHLPGRVSIADDSCCSSSSLTLEGIFTNSSATLCDSMLFLKKLTIANNHSYKMTLCKSIHPNYPVFGGIALL